MKKVALIIVLCLILFGLGYFYAVKTSKPEYITNTVTKVDTIYIRTEPVIKWKTAVIEKTVFDTLIIADKDTIILKDTVQIASDKVDFKEGHLNTWYYFPPVNRFKYDWNPVPQAIIYQKETITVVKKLKWFERKGLWGAVGLAIGLYVGGK